MKKNLSIIVFLMGTFSLMGEGTLVEPGIDVFIKHYTQLVKGKKVGLITNPTGLSKRLNSTVDILYLDKRVNLLALFSPEHGIRGNVHAGKQVQSSIDPSTNLPIYTLYGRQGHCPTAESLVNIDVLIYDIQDVGSRSYTYIWTLAETMRVAAKYKKTVIVLDRPNPLGGLVVDGPITETKWLSFIGLYPIPRVYGMTVGELALLLNSEFNLGCHLQVVPMKNYRRGMSWSETGLFWVPTSPHIPSVQSAICFAATGTIGELGNVSIGVGYTLPFQCVAAPWINAAKMSYALNKMNLPGVKFRAIYYKPFYGIFKGKEIEGIQLCITDSKVFLPTSTEISILYYLKHTYPRTFTFPRKSYSKFDKAMGTSLIRQSIQSKKSLNSILKYIYTANKQFLLKRQKYLLY